MDFIEGAYVGDAQEHHDRMFPDDVRPTLWWFDVQPTSLVLGSTQSDSVVDLDACRDRGIPVARRRSGGGLVIVGSGRVLWLDVLIPRDHPLWDDDLSRSGLWLARAWVDGLARVGVDDATIHDGPMVRTEWSSLICFDGRGPGEVFRGDSKLVGVSQRRTREWARFQCSLSLRWDPTFLADVIAVEGFDPSRVASSATNLDVDVDTIRRAVGDSIKESIGRR